jgi:hypothetical protein
LIIVVSSNAFQLSVHSVNVYHVLSGLAGRETTVPDFTSIGFIADHPLTLNVTIYPSSHCAYNVILSVESVKFLTGTQISYSIPDQSASVFHPITTFQLFVNLLFGRTCSSSYTNS